MTNNKKILIVDDDPDMCEYLSTFFSDKGFVTETAKDGMDALDKVEAALPDLITLDITMPEKSGVKFYREIKENEQRSSIPIIIITGVSQDFQKFIESRKQVPPPDGYLAKPPDLDELLALTQKLIA